MIPQRAYTTLSNTRRIMDVVQEEQAPFREEMDSVKRKIEQIFEAIQALARREEEACATAAVSNGNLIQVDTL